MSPIPLGILAASQTGVVGSDFQYLESILLDGATTQSTLTFTNLVSAYSADFEHLQLRLVARTNRGATGDALFMQFNNRASGYYFHRGIRNAAAYNVASNQDFIYFGDTNGNLGDGSNYSISIVDILDPFLTTRKTTIQSFHSVMGDATQSRNIYYGSGHTLETIAINEIDITCLASFNRYTRASIYGLRSVTSV